MQTPDLQGAFARFERFLYSSSRIKFFFTLWALMLIRTGIWYMPNLGLSRLVAVDPFSNSLTDPASHYLFMNWLGPFLAHVLHATGKVPFFAVHLLFTLAFTVTMVIGLFRQHHNQEARTSIVLFFSLPVSATAYYWVGMDSLILWLMSLALMAPPRIILCGVLGLLLGLQHFEQALLAYGVLVAVLFAARKSDRQSRPIGKWAAVLIGIVLGRLLLSVIFQACSIELMSSREGFLVAGTSNTILQFFLHIHVLLWSLFGVAWLAIFRFLRHDKHGLLFAAGLAVLGLTLPLVHDQTRVFGIVSFPLISVFLLTNGDFLRMNNRLAVWLFLFWIVTPWCWVWVGTARGSAFPYDIVALLHRLFGWFVVPSDPSVWPFKSIWP